jgi:hypothetical protein
MEISAAQTFKRPEWIAQRDFTPIVPVGDEALLQYSQARRAAAEWVSGAPRAGKGISRRRAAAAKIFPILPLRRSDRHLLQSRHRAALQSPLFASLCA